MFERLISKVIQCLNFIADELEKAYYETYGDRATKEGKDLSFEFYCEVDKRRVLNKDAYIKNAAIYVGTKTLQEQGYIMPPNQALAIAEVMFQDAQKNGKIDFLNNIINEE